MMEIIFKVLAKETFGLLFRRQCNATATIGTAAAALRHVS